ncbi:hypothetical protein GUJ93_ZPchr0002g25096 [Zizania palustris]|uniref:Uncharacterized protein n=1 Tax=Zizania palustris TaxID=103762 RepID=A0A8J5SIY1_ZIZPA|nr:hypothetical protein GUJ93_ZPchr0002g25096 [Zizania palustris]
MSLRVSQCAFASGSVVAMASAYGFSNYTAFWKQWIDVAAFPMSCCLPSGLQTQHVLPKLSSIKVFTNVQHT